MTTIPYLSERNGRFYFRRRIPGLSTSVRPVLVSLGTTDRNLGHRSCVQLTAYMDRMLDEDLHIDLPEAEVTGFFQAELRHCVAKLRQRRMLERMDGSLTAGKARRNHLVAQVLHGMVEDGIREEIPEERLYDLDPADHDLAAGLQRALPQVDLAEIQSGNPDPRGRLRHERAAVRRRKALDPLGGT